MTGSLDPGLSLTWRALRYWRLAAVAAAVLAADQATKAWIVGRLPFNTYGEGSIAAVPGLLYIVHVGNTGAAWSILAGRNLVLAAVAAASLVGIFLGRRGLGLAAPSVQACFGLICGGIAGNLIDRMARRHVVDFLDFHFGSYVYPTFNVADSAICIGVACYVIHSLRGPPRPAPG